jgi:hypothetical protein
MMDFWLQYNDLEIQSGDIAFCPTDREALAQAIAVRLKTLAGEWFLDAALGIPYLNEIFGHKRNERFMRQVILPEIEAISGVHQVRDFKVQEKTNRQLLISFVVVSGDGTVININESIGV